MIEFRRDKSDSFKIDTFGLYNTIETVIPNSKIQPSSKFYQFNILKMWELTQFAGFTVKFKMWELTPKSGLGIIFENFLIFIKLIVNFGYKCQASE
ncbi:hypothetical protein LIF_A1350 [Leptospira interrogans serovar Lai str. IPAV]|nr:hypothetical protein LIF_A1350 [Leptospira interrogans serovar Lai str. IPAV]